MRADDLLSLSGKVALVTGAGHGIGRAYAEAMAECGADVAAVDLNADLAEGAAQYVRSLGRRGVAVQADVTAEADVVRAFDEAIAALGRLDAVFANVGGSGPSEWSALGEITLEEWQQTIQFNLTASMLTVREAARRMAPQGRGKIICTASNWGLVSPDSVRLTPYAAAKGGVVNFVRSAATLLARQGIQINAIAPGPIETGRRTPERAAITVQRVPLGRQGQPDELKGTAVLLASAASDYMVGAIIPVDGGLTAW